MRATGILTRAGGKKNTIVESEMRWTVGQRNQGGELSVKKKRYNSRNIAQKQGETKNKVKKVRKKTQISGGNANREWVSEVERTRRGGGKSQKEESSGDQRGTK